MVNGPSIRDAEVNLQERSPKDPPPNNDAPSGGSASTMCRTAGAKDKAPRTRRKATEAELAAQATKSAAAAATKRLNDQAAQPRHARGHFFRRWLEQLQAVAGQPLSTMSRRETIARLETLAAQCVKRLETLHDRSRAPLKRTLPSLCERVCTCRTRIGCVRIARAFEGV